MGTSYHGCAESVCVAFLVNTSSYITHNNDLASSQLSMKTVHHFQLFLAQTVRICTAGTEIVPLYTCQHLHITMQMFGQLPLRI